MTKTKLNIFSVLLSFVMLTLLCFVFSACNIQDGRTVYTNLTLKYTQFMEDTPEMFTGGQVVVKYNQKLKDAMYTDSGFAKLKEDALFEPVLVASLQGVNYYINHTDLEKVNVPQKDAEVVYNNLEEFKQKVSEFLTAKHNIENRDAIVPSSPIEQDLLAKLCEKYQQLINSANVFGKSYLDLYQKKIFEDFQRKTTTERFAVGKMRLNYFQKLNEFANIEANNRVAYYADKKYESLQQESICYPLLQSYKKVDSYSLWEGSEAEISATEAECISTFTNWLNYQPLYAQELNNYKLALEKIDLSKYYAYLSGLYAESDFTTEEKIYFAKIDAYFNTYATNLVNYMTKLCNNVYNFKHS